ncbi:MAG: hypothetical protein LIO44_02785 [Eubacterium sp.]|nr:hypothetical protein [Eubacterium sp.]
MYILHLFKRNTDRDLIVNGNLLRAILCLAIPIVLNNFIQNLYNLTDTYRLGRIGKESVAAITVVSPVQ